jgi:hypothetical protein
MASMPSEIGTSVLAANVCAPAKDRRQFTTIRGGLSRQEAHNEIRNTDVCGRGPIVVADFGGRTAICLRCARGRLYRERSRLCGPWSRNRRAAVCGTRGCVWGTGLRAVEPRLRRTRICRTGTSLRSAGLWATGARLQGSCLLWGRRTSVRGTAGARLPIRLCGGLCTKTTRRHPLQRRRSLCRQSRLRSVGILQLRQAAPSAAPLSALQSAAVNKVGPAALGQARFAVRRIVAAASQRLRRSPASSLAWDVGAMSGKQIRRMGETSRAARGGDSQRCEILAHG